MRTRGRRVCRVEESRDGRETAARNLHLARSRAHACPRRARRDAWRRRLFDVHQQPFLVGINVATGERASLPCGSASRANQSGPGTSGTVVRAVAVLELVGRLCTAQQERTGRRRALAGNPLRPGRSSVPRRQRPLSPSWKRAGMAPAGSARLAGDAADLVRWQCDEQATEQRELERAMAWSLESLQEYPRLVGAVSRTLCLAFWHGERSLSGASARQFLLRFTLALSLLRSPCAAAVSRGSELPANLGSRETLEASLEAPGRRFPPPPNPSTQISLSFHDACPQLRQQLVASSVDLSAESDVERFYGSDRSHLTFSTQKTCLLSPRARARGCPLPRNSAVQTTRSDPTMAEAAAPRHSGSRRDGPRL